MSASPTIYGRAWVYDTGDPVEMEFWCHELEPMEGRKLPCAEWARIYFAECMSEDDIRELFDLPAVGSYQVLFSGTMEAETTLSLDVGEDCDEWFDLEKHEHAEIPAEFMK